MPKEEKKSKKSKKEKNEVDLSQLSQIEESGTDWYSVKRSIRNNTFEIAMMLPAERGEKANFISSGRQDSLETAIEKVLEEWQEKTD